MKRSKKDRIRSWLESGNEITPRDAIDKFNAFRLSAIIFDLKEEGLNIKNVKKSGYAVYKLIPEGQLAL